MRLSDNPASRPGLYARIAFFFTRRSLERLTGVRHSGAVEPLELYARTPSLLRGYAALERASAKRGSLGRRYQALAELRAATMTGCEFCIDMGSQISRQWGLSDAEILALAEYRISPLFSEVDRLVLDYAGAMSRTPVEVSDELFNTLHATFNAVELVELTHHVALENMRGRFNHAFAIGSAGFSNGRACALPLRSVSAPPTADHSAEQVNPTK